MRTPPIPTNERQRLSSLYALQILDTPAEERFDRITRLATRLFDVPMCMVTLVDDNRQWFKSIQGLPVCETPRDVSFCGHAIMQKELFLVPDALLDPRFCDNPLVIGDPWIRFYAGYPLSTLNGSIIGSLCILDRTPRSLSASDQQALRDLGAWVENEVNTAEISRALLQRESEAHLRAMMESSNEGLMLLSPDGHILTVNEYFNSSFGLQPDEIKGQLYNTVVARLEPLFASTQPLSQLIIDTLANTEREDTACVEQCFPDKRILELSSAPVHTAEGGYLGRLYVFRDITERAALEAMIKHQAYHDPLTGLPNRTLLHERITQALLTVEQSPIALFMLDLDRFKEINDTVGHEYGDLLLQQVALRLRQVVPVDSTVARLGGDEFAILLPNGDEEHALATARTILKEFEAPFIVNALPFHIETSIGIGLSPVHGTSALKLWRHADVAMYTAKRSHEGCAFYDEKKDEYTLHRLALIEALRQAIHTSELKLYYQPIVDLRTGEIHGVEALARWQHPEFGFITPDQFIPLAEQTGLIMPLTLWVIETAVRQCRDWRAAGYFLKMSVNLSMRNLHDDTLPEIIASVLQQYDVPASCLCVELTETAVMSDIVRTLDVLRRLFNLGIEISVDDFGTGYSSLVYLKRLPIDELKIDRAFIQHMSTIHEDVTIVRTIVVLAHSLGIRVVAEGVEDLATWQLLSTLKCDMLQGYYFSRPVPANEIMRLLQTPQVALAS